VHPGDLEAAGEIWAEHWGTKTEHDNYFRLKRYDGEYRHFHCHAVPVFNDDGSFKHFQGFNVDITDRKQAEEDLKASEKRYRDLFENANDLIQAVNTNGSFIYVNLAWKKLLGYKANCPTLPFLILFIPIAWNIAREYLRECFQGKKSNVLKRHL
ncbi:MAG: hypothetical protein B6D64_02200, partial [Bacteroidetes bacterium 4484_276]